MLQEFPEATNSLMAASTGDLEMRLHPSHPHTEHSPYRAGAQRIRAAGPWRGAATGNSPSCLLPPPHAQGTSACTVTPPRATLPKAPSPHGWVAQGVDASAYRFL